MRGISETIRQKFGKLVSLLKEDLDRDNGLYWNLSFHDGRVRDQSHWCGERRWNERRWIEYGNFHFNLLSEYIRTWAGPDYLQSLRSGTALEWGCGGGANVRVLCHHFAHVYGVDISRPTLAECERQITRFGFQNFKTVLLRSEDPEALLKRREEESIDCVLSVAVFQHFPSKAYSQRVLHVIERLMKKGACALIQVRYFDGSEKLRQKYDDYAKNVIHMTSFTFEEFSHQLSDAGLTLIHSERGRDDPQDCHEYYFVRK